MDFALPIAITPVSAGASHLNSPQHTGNSSMGLVSHLADHFIPHARNNYHPHIFSHRMTGLFSALLITLKIFSIAAIAWGPIAPAFSEAITVTNIISLTNQSRQSQNLSGLIESSVLDKAAQAKADDMLAKGYFSHTTPDGKTPWDFITAAGYNYITAGENLAVNFTEAENVEDAWMNSPGHRANILNSVYKDIGIGISQGSYQGHDAIFVVQMFGTLADQKITLNDAPTQVQQQTVPAPTPKTSLPKVVPQKITKVVPITATVPTSTTSVIADGFSLSSIKAVVTSNTVNISVTAPGAVKVVAVYNLGGVMLQAKSGNVWEGSLSLAQLVNNKASVTIKAYSIDGRTLTAAAGDFSLSVASNFAVNPQVKSAHSTIAGVTFDPKILENNFYLLFIAVMLLSLILAIGIKHRIQHVSLVANGAIVVLLAVMLWLR